MKTMIAADNAGFTYEGSAEPALQGINLNIAEGCIFGIAGPAGSGKSTLAMCLNGAIPHCIEGALTGQILVNGFDTARISLNKLSSLVGSVFQDVESQVVSSIVEDEILFGLENMNFSRSEMEERLVESLAAVGLSNFRHSAVRQLSGGQKQRVAIASALALRPRLLVMDEPTSELDPWGAEEIFRIIARLNIEKGITIVVIEQKLNLLAQYCGRIAVLDSGCVVKEGNPREILSGLDFLEQIGLQVPTSARLFNKMARAGILSPKIPVSDQEAVIFLEELLAGKG